MTKKKLRAWSLMFQKTDQATDFPDYRQVIHALKGLDPQKYSFQLEKGGEKGRLHFQINLVLNEPLFGSDLREKLRYRLKKFWCAGCLSYSPLHSQNDHELYCHKEQTRVAGPWSDKPIYLGRDLVRTREYYPWQRSVMCIAKRKYVDPRAIYVIIDPCGNIGKSELTKSLAFNCDSCVIPLGLSSAQIKAAITSTHARKNYILDLPRNGGNQQDLYSAIEELKRGFVVSSFHGKLKNLFMDRPNVFVFTNKIPSLFLMSFDMWKLLTIDPKTRQLRVLNKWEILSWQKIDEEKRKDKCIESFILNHEDPLKL